MSDALRDAMAALKPFADELDGAWGGLARDHEPIENFIGINIRVGDLRRAAKAYEALRANSSDVSVPGEQLRRLLSASKLLLANARGCIVAHHGKEEAELPQWFVDCQTDVFAGDAMLSASPQAKGEGDG